MTPLLECRSLCRSYGNRQALHDFSCTLSPGQVVGLLGPNGAGKSTLLRILAGVSFQSSGEYIWKGCTNWNASSNWRRSVGYLAEHNPLVPELTARSHLRFCGVAQDLSGQSLRKAIARMEEECHLTGVLDHPVGELSRGYRQRVGLACALLHDPELLLLDEPTTGLDPNEIASLLALVRRLGFHKTVVHSTHILSEAQATCDRVWILRNGNLVADAPPAVLSREAPGHRVELETLRPVAEEVLKKLAGVSTVDVLVRDNVYCYTIGLMGYDGNASARIGEACHGQDVPVIGLRVLAPGLDVVFARLTCGEDA